MLLWSVTHLNAAIFINTVMFLQSSQRQTHFGSLALDQANHLSSYFCTWPPLSNTPSHSSLCPTRHLWLACPLPSQLSASHSLLIKVIDLPKSCLSTAWCFVAAHIRERIGSVWRSQILWNIKHFRSCAGWGAPVSASQCVFHLQFSAVHWNEPIYEATVCMQWKPLQLKEFNQVVNQVKVNQQLFW